MSQQCLPLPKKSKDKNIPNNNISGALEISSLENMDAMTYLGLVHQEATLLPDTFINDVPDEHKSKKSKVDNSNNSNNKDENDGDDFMAIEGTQVYADILLSKRMDLIPCKSITLLPKRSWITNCLNDFEILRNYLDECIDDGRIGQNRECRLPVPRMKDREGWHEFCLGKQEAHGNINGYFDDDDESIHSTSTSSSIPPWMNNLPQEGYTPSVSLILQLDQNMTRYVLSHLTYFLSLNWPISTSRLLWIYSLLAHVHKPLHGDDQAVLRLLLRLCTKARAKFNNNDDGSILASINLVIVVLAFYFQQGDSSVMDIN